MTLADDFRQLDADLADLFGQEVTLTVRTATTYSAAGTVTETTRTATVTAEGPVRDLDRYGAAGRDVSSGSDQSVTATWYVPALGLALVPKKGDRITAGTVVWQIVAVETYTLNGQTTSYRCDCGEVAA